MASLRSSRDSSAPDTLGANPPSSPTLTAVVSMIGNAISRLTVLAVLLGNDLLEDVVSLGSHLHGLGEGAGSSWEQHELLEGKSVTGVLTTVDDVESRGGEDVWGLDTSKLGNVLVEWDTLNISTFVISKI